MEALDREVAYALRHHPILDRRIDGLADEYLAGLCLVAQPRGEVGDTADRGVIEAPLEADCAQRREALRNADAETEIIAAPLEIWQTPWPTAALRQNATWLPCRQRAWLMKQSSNSPKG